MNDSGQFVGTYYRTSEWAVDMFGNLGPSRFEVGNFIATPQEEKKLPKLGKKNALVN